MKIRKNNLLKSCLLVAIALLISWNFVLADDLNPPSYRGLPLSVHAHWSGDTGLPMQPDWHWIDDTDPATYLFPGLSPSFIVIGDPAGSGSIYQFTVPNIVDELPLKLLRIQLTWVGTTKPPIDISAHGLEGNGDVTGVVAFASSPNIYTQPDGGYQYFDIEFRPNPDYEVIDIYLPEKAELVQVVIDSISTVPEPATLSILALGGVVMMYRRNKNRSC